MENNKNTKVNVNTYVSIITSIVNMAATQVVGVASVSIEAGSLMNRIKTRATHSIEVDMTANNQVIVTLSINAYTGYKIPVIACELQEKIKTEIEKTTFYKVKAVNVNVVGVIEAN